MPGLLDFYGDSQANLALAAGLLSGGNFGQALSRGMSGAQALIDSQDERKRRNEYMQAQAENLRSEVAKRQHDMEKATRLQALIDRATGGGGPGGAGPVSGDAYLPGAPPSAPSQGGPRGGMAGLFSPETLAALKLNGVDLVDVAKLAKPEWQNFNGNLVNTNDPGFKGGFLPGMATSANGQVTMWQPDGAGGLVVGAPKGAIDTHRAYQAAGKQAENDNTLAPLDRLDPATGRPYAATTGQLVRQVQGAQPPASAAEQGMRQQMAGGWGNTASDYAREIAQTRASLQNQRLDPASRQMLEQHLEATVAQAQRAGQGAPRQQPPALGLSAAPSVPTGGSFNGFAGPADIERAVGQVKADLQPTQARQAGIDGAMNAFKLVDQALAHPGLATATGLSGSLDPRNYIPGTDAKNYNVLGDQIKGNAFLSAYAQLKGAGAITEQEGTKATAAIARLNQAQSTEEYKAALKDYQAVIGQGLKRMGVDPSTLNAGGAPKAGRIPVAQGVYGGRKVIKYSDGSTDYAD